MPRYPTAHWRPVSGHTDGPMQSHLGLVLHVNVSDGNLYNWVAGDNNMSCHFEVYKDGSIEQYLDTANSSWCQKSGNATYLSVETEGYPKQPLTSAQVSALAKLLVWCHTTHGIPLQLAEHVGARGLGWHGMGGDAWGHPDCPGTLRKAQRATVVSTAKALTAPRPARKSVLVKKGDTLTSIAAAHHLTLAALDRLNPQIPNLDEIAIGQKVYVS